MTNFQGFQVIVLLYVKINTNKLIIEIRFLSKHPTYGSDILGVALMYLVIPADVQKKICSIPNLKKEVN
jgi:hypothetical protein